LNKDIGSFKPKEIEICNRLMNNKKINNFKTKPCKVKEMTLQKLEQQRKLQYTKPETFYLNSKKDSV
jgi:hypothetical protein